MNLATNGMMGSATKRKRIVKGNTSATSVERLGTEERSVENLLEEPEELYLKHPRYLCQSIWADPNATPHFSPTACCTVTDAPLPRPPHEEFNNVDAMLTIEQN